jgi:hypothetical protein
VKGIPFKVFINDEKAISEEFTSLPALAVIMIAFTLFFALIANVYISYENRVESLDKYQTADFIATKLTNPDCYFMQLGGTVDLQMLNTDSSNEELNNIRQEYIASGIDFILRISWDDSLEDFPENMPNDVFNRVAVSRNVGIRLNDAETTPGKLTIIMWSV